MTVSGWAKIQEGVDLKRWLLAHVPELPFDDTVVFKQVQHIDGTERITVGWSTAPGVHHTHELLVLSQHRTNSYDMPLDPDTLTTLRVKAKMSLCL